jgi:DNA-binding NarL/FixJ family response regulator
MPLGVGLQRRVLVVEDEALTRSLVADALRREGFDVRSCADAAEATAHFRAFDPDAVVCDLDLGSGADGLTLLSALTTASPSLGVVVLSNYTVPPARRAPALAAAVHLHKRALADVSELVAAVDTALSGAHRPGELTGQRDGVLERLTPAQLEVLRLIASGRSNAAIAARRDTTVRAIEQISQRIFRALDVPTDSAHNPRVLAARAYLAEAGFTERPERA